MPHTSFKLGIIMFMYIVHLLYLFIVKAGFHFWSGKKSKSPTKNILIQRTAAVQGSLDLN